VDPDDPRNTFVLPYWRVLAAIDAEQATVYNTPGQNLVAARSSNPDFQCAVYKQSLDTYLIIVANLGAEAAQAEIMLVPGVLGMSGEYQLGRVDPETGIVTPQGRTSAKIVTGRLSPWAFEGWKLGRQ